MSPTAESVAFCGSSSDLIKNILHRLYRENRIFLRELVCNAIDAINKVRYLSRSDPTLLADGEELGIRIITKSSEDTLTIADNGIGMTKEDLTKCLGRVAYSGTKEFKAKLSPDDADTFFYGENGLGFYSVFNVADRVEVVTKHKDDAAYIFECTDLNSYTIRPYDKEDIVGRGTSVTLHLNGYKRDNLIPMLLEHELHEYIKRIDCPITIESDWGSGLGDGKFMNSKWPLEDWNTATEEELMEMYQKLTAEGEPLLVKHYKYAENAINFEVLMVLPGRRPFCNSYGTALLFWRDLALKTYKNFLPKSLNFFIFIMKVSDAMVNVSRTGINDEFLPVIRQFMTEKTFEILNEIAENPVMFTKFHDKYRDILLMGAIEDTEYRQILLDFMGFHTLKNTDSVIRMPVYVREMKPNQKEIYFLLGDDMDALARSSVLESYKKDDIDVILVDDELTQKIFRGLNSYQDLKLVDVSETPQLNTMEDYSQLTIEYERLCEKMKELLGDRIGEVEISRFKMNEPCCCVSSCKKKSLLINPRDPIINRLKELLEKTEIPDALWKNNVKLLYSIAVIRSGGYLDNFRILPKVMYKMVHAYLEDIKLRNIKEDIIEDGLKIEIGASRLNALK